MLKISLWIMDYLELTRNTAANFQVRPISNFADAIFNHRYLTHHLRIEVFEVEGKFQSKCRLLSGFICS